MPISPAKARLVLVFSGGPDCMVSVAHQNTMKILNS